MEGHREVGGVAPVAQTMANTGQQHRMHLLHQHWLSAANEGHRDKHAVATVSSDSSAPPSVPVTPVQGFSGCEIPGCGSLGRGFSRFCVATDDTLGRHALV